ncbi:MAG: DegV family protein [Solobacterium sp.]|nr:DegV family protein [Solobacterium sp.]
MKYRIVSDSSSNLTVYDTDVDFISVPLKIRIDDVEYVDDADLNVADMVAHMQASKKPSTTSCPNSYEWLQSFEGADCIFCVTISANLSGSYNSCVHAREVYLGEHPEAKIHIVNSKATGATMQMIIEKIEEGIRKELSFEAIVTAITEYQRHVKIVFCLESLYNLAKNGRCPMALAKIAGVLGIRFIGKASDEGTIMQASIARGAKKANKASLAEMEKLGYQGGRVWINHCLSPENAYRLKDLIHEKYPNADVNVNQTTGLCSFYAEEGGLIIGFDDYA